MRARLGVQMRECRRFTLGGVVVAVMLVVVGCSEPVPLSPSAARGRQVYLALCMSCHGPDPAQDGPVGPALKGASRELLEARVLHGSYPPGYPPKRPTNTMPVVPAAAADIPVLADYLR